MVQNENLKMFPKGDLRRTWMVLGAIDRLPHASARSIATELKLPVSTVQSQLTKLTSSEIPGLIVSSLEGSYEIDDWGIFLNKSGVRQFFDEWRYS